MSQFDSDGDCGLQSIVKPLGNDVVSIPTDKILAFLPGYMQRGGMFNLRSCDLLHTAAHIVGEGVFHLLLFSCRPIGIHFHIHRCTPLFVNSVAKSRNKNVRD